MRRVTPEARRQFLDALWYSEPARWRVARWFSTRGYAVSLPSAMHSHHLERVFGQEDEGDIQITMRIEVKQISSEFTCREDWPFPDFIVTSRYQFDYSRPRPHAFAVVNPSATHIGIVMTRKWKTWTIDRRNGVAGIDIDATKEYYIAKLDDVRFYKLNADKPDWDNNTNGEPL
jgi:hypothetical protein